MNFVLFLRLVIYIMYSVLYDISLFIEIVMTYRWDNFIIFGYAYIKFWEIEPTFI